jgi:hypothetical protein
MNTIYKLKWRRGDLGFWHSLKVIGHQYETGSNKLIVYFPEGGLREIAHWNDCEILLGPDWSKLTNDDSGNTDEVKDKLALQQDIIPPELPPEKEEIDDRTSS